MSKPLRILCTIPGVQITSVRAIIEVASVTELAPVNPIAVEPKCFVTDIAGGQYHVFEDFETFADYVDLSDDPWYEFTKPSAGADAPHVRCLLQVASFSEIECPTPVDGSILMTVRDVGGTVHQVLETIDHVLGTDDVVGEEEPEAPAEPVEPPVEAPVEEAPVPEAPVAAEEPAAAAEPAVEAPVEAGQG